MWLVAVGLLALVVYLGRQSPGPAATSLPPDNSVPPVGASPVLSPAMTGANPNINGTNQVALQASAQYVDNNSVYVKRIAPSQRWAAQRRSVTGGNYMTDAQSQLRTQDVPPLVQTVTNTTPTGQKL